MFISQLNSGIFRFIVGFFCLFPSLQLTAQNSSLLFEETFNNSSDLTYNNGSQEGPPGSGVSGLSPDKSYSADLSQTIPDSDKKPAGLLISDKEVNNAQEATATLWFKLRKDHGNSGTLLQGYIWNVGIEDDKISLWLYSSAEQNAMLKSKSLAVNSDKWIFLAITWSNKDRQVTFYKGATDEPVEELSVHTINEFPSPINIGTNNKIGIGNNAVNTDSPFDGSIDNVRLYQTSISLEDIEKIRQADAKNLDAPKL